MKPRSETALLLPPEAASAVSSSSNASSSSPHPLRRPGRAGSGRSRTSSTTIGLARELDRVRVIAGQERGVGRERVVHRVQGIELARAAHRRRRLRVPARVARIDPEDAGARTRSRGRARWRGAAPPPPPAVPLVPEGLTIPSDVCASARSGSARTACAAACASARQDLQRGRVAVDRAGRIGVGETRPGQRVVAIDLGRALEALDGLARRGRRELVPEVAAAQVEVVRLRMARLPPGERGQALGESRSRICSAMAVPSSRWKASMLLGSLS